MNPEELNDKSHYSQLTDKQQKVIDYLAEHPNTTYADVASEIDVHDTYVGGIARKYEHILEERKATKDNDHMNTHANGMVKTEGEIDLTDEQTISERPVKQTENEDSDGAVVVVDDALAERLEAISSDVTPGWMDSTASPCETVRYLARMYHGEVSE